MPSLKERYYAPTPVVARKVGDTLMSIGAAIAGSGLMTASPIIGYIGLGVTVLSKLANLFVDDGVIQK